MVATSCLHILNKEVDAVMSEITAEEYKKKIAAQLGEAIDNYIKIQNFPESRPMTKKFLELRIKHLKEVLENFESEDEDESI